MPRKMRRLPLDTRKTIRDELTTFVKTHIRDRGANRADIAAEARHRWPALGNSTLYFFLKGFNGFNRLPAGTIVRPPKVFQSSFAPKILLAMSELAEKDAEITRKDIIRKTGISEGNLSYHLGPIKRIFSTLTYLSA